MICSNIIGPSRIGQTLKGKLGSYTLTQRLAEQVWQASSSLGGDVIVKTLPPRRLLTERNNLARFQTKTPHIRPFIDEINPGKETYALVLKFFDEDLGDVIQDERLGKSELKLVARSTLEALRDLHADGWIHADVKPGNILINRPVIDEELEEITEAQLSDLEDAVPEGHRVTQGGKTVGTLPYTSPENLLRLPWSTSTDIWSFGATMISLIHGYDYDIFQAHLLGSFDPDYPHKILQRHHRFFGPFPGSFREIADAKTMSYLARIMHKSSSEELHGRLPSKIHPGWAPGVAKATTEIMRQPVSTPYRLPGTFPELCDADRAFILRIMKLDPRDRPTAKELLQDVWFDQDGQSSFLESEHRARFFDTVDVRSESRGYE